ncbi:MAG: DUF1015 family protein [Nitriliruptoraceae bacterium]
MTRLAIEPLHLHVVAADAAVGLIPPAAPHGQTRLPAGNLGEVFDDEAADPVGAGDRTRNRMQSLIERGRYRRCDAVMAIHQMQRDNDTATALVAALPRAVFTSDAVLPHEATHSDREVALQAFLAAAALDLSPIILAYGNEPALSEVIATVTERASDEEFTDLGNTRHRIWLVDDRQTQTALAEAVGRVSQASVVDGHHRLAAARADQTANAVMVELFADGDIELLAFDRQVVMSASDVAAFVGQMLQQPSIEVVAETQPRRPADHREFLFHASRWYRARFVEPASDLVAGLSPVRLQTEVLAPMCGITDPRTDVRLRHWPSTTEPANLSPDRLDAASVYFVPAAVSMEDIHRVACRRRVLPPKSTFVAGKPPPGIFVALRVRYTTKIAENTVA